MVSPQNATFCIHGPRFIRKHHNSDYCCIQIDGINFIYAFNLVYLLDFFFFF